ncbi:carbohydrate ABC transporter membrane protein 2 (CUT1 family) [Nonomuraea polychroma]|uniref:Carbohydrate ABC transporter membrane protein 2 (CUT1 family) n=1 Tax=Nonomuraea polychroma TaxID=46176 RepID=A0A438LZ11_9ACTN|nr:carbohydrate ABC transporter permease [Nonomuraea polychroma]RVX38597.1 carbohydrate ABC transporter membrane protein 2 (CUT1 family) [Nonomuraea polychroma]
MTTTLAKDPAQAAARHAAPGQKRVTRRPNWVAGTASWIWLAIVIVPIYWIVITSFKAQSDYYAENPLAPPSNPTLANYQLVIESDFVRYFMNSVIVTVGAVVPAVAVSFMAAYAIVRSGRGRFLRYTNSMFLMGLAIPHQATIIPIYLIIIKLGLYDTPMALILPSIAFSIPLSVLVLSNFIRDVPKELFESMRLDGASELGTLWNLALPLTRPAVVTVTIYNALTIWNGFLLPLILTQSPEQRTLPLALWTFQGQYSVNVPAVLASVVLTTLPILVIYVVGRRQLLAGLTAGFGK